MNASTAVGIARAGRAGGRCLPRFFAAAATLFLAAAHAAPAGGTPADLVVRNAYVYTVDAHDSAAQALAVRAGRIVYVGKDAGVARLIGPATQVLDLGGRMLMPGLVDARLHLLQGGAGAACDLAYVPLGVEQMQQRIQSCLDASKDQEPVGWLRVVGWQRAAMQGAAIDGAMLDALKTDRPIVVESTDGHALLANRRAVNMAHLSRATAEPVDGRIGRDADGNPNGVFEDGGRAPLWAAMPRASAADNLRDAQAALDALRRQGVTTFLDAGSSSTALAAFATLYKRGALTARGHFAPVVDAADAADPGGIVKGLKITMALYDTGALAPAPGMTVRSAQIHLDGIVAAPAQTAALLAPYRSDAGRAGKPHWVAGTYAGPLYLPAQVLNPLLVELGRAGIEPQIHAAGDRAVHQALDAIEVLRNAVPHKDLRVAVAPVQLIDTADTRRFRALDAVPVMTFQHARPGPDTVDAMRDFLGGERYGRLEPTDALYEAKARLAYGSDWPADVLDEWLALKVAVTRSADAPRGSRYAGRLNTQKPLQIAAALRAITLNAAYALHEEADIGSLEVGKLADFIVLDRNVLGAAPEYVAQTRVLLTVVGGATVYRDPAF